MKRLICGTGASSPLLLVLVVFGASVGAADEAKQPPFAVKVVGSGRPMILIPGLACGGDVWNTTVARYRDKYECHVLTLAGFAGQPAAKGPFVDTIRRGIADYIRAKKLTKPVIVGHSLGGFLVYALGANEPELVGPLVAVDGLPCLSALFNDKLDPETVKRQAEQARERLEKASRDQYLAQSKALFKVWIADAKLRETCEKWTEDSDQATVARAMGELMATDLRPELTRIKSPVLVLGASSKDMEAFGMTRDKVTQRYQDQVARVARNKVAIAPNAKHFIMYDDLDWMCGQIDGFLTKQ
jgi:pimeloyl-ACP methyl ester carboxylesterase